MKGRVFMRFLMIGLLVLWTFSCAACALPRAAYMESRVKSEAPRIAGATKESVGTWASIIPDFPPPSGTITFVSPLPPVQTFEQYKAQLLARGWKPEGYGTPWDPPVPHSD